MHNYLNVSYFFEARVLCCIKATKTWVHRPDFSPAASGFRNSFNAISQFQREMASALAYTGSPATIFLPKVNGQTISLHGDSRFSLTHTLDCQPVHFYTMVFIWNLWIRLIEKARMKRILEKTWNDLSLLYGTTLVMGLVLQHSWKPSSLASASKQVAYFGFWQRLLLMLGVAS